MIQACNISDLASLLYLFNSRHACRVFHVGTGIADEHAPVRRLDRTQLLGVERRIRRKQSVQIENVSGDAGRRSIQMNQLLGLVYKLGCD